MNTGYKMTMAFIALLMIVGIEPTIKVELPDELKQVTNLSLEEELNDWQTQLNVTNVISLNEFVEQGGEPVMDAKNNSHFIQPEESVQEEELKKVLMESLELLTEKEKKVILLYYYEDMISEQNFLV